MKHALLLVLIACAAAAAPARNSCAECHSEQADQYRQDIHLRYGFSCTACHGGDASSDDLTIAKSKAKGFKGAISRTAVPKLCASCHSDATVMHRYRPGQRVDQLQQFMTSVHGRRLAKGDTGVANCVDCHSVHGIREVRDALSPVHPLRLANTCATCHSNASHMAKYNIDTNQHEEYKASVHWAAVSKRGDLSAPTCASCHGNHGATPPEVSSVSAVCGTCHVMMEDLYSKSMHAELFAAMGTGGCSNCHGNHEIRKPGPEMLAGPDSVCQQCHDDGSTGGKVAIQMASLITKLTHELDRADEILGRARRSGMEVSEAQLRQMEGREALIMANVAVHSFDLAEVEKPAMEGLAIAAEGVQAGELALKERDTRRLGLVVFLFAALVAMAGLRMAIRAVEGGSGATETTGR
jgi:predicted CXXCH cytochrome family protein